MRAGTIFINYYFYHLVAEVLHPGHLQDTWTLLLAEVRCWLPASQVGTSPGINNNGNPGYVGDAVNEQCFVLRTHFWLSLAASDFQMQDPQLHLAAWGSHGHAGGREMSSFSGFLGSPISFSQPECAALWASLLLSWNFSQEIAKLILEAKAVERGQLWMQPEYLPANQLWNLIDAQVFS